MPLLHEGVTKLVNVNGKECNGCYWYWLYISVIIIMIILYYVVLCGGYDMRSIAAIWGGNIDNIYII